MRVLVQRSGKASVTIDNKTELSEDEMIKLYNIYLEGLQKVL